MRSARRAARTFLLPGLVVLAGCGGDATEGDEASRTGTESDGAPETSWTLSPAPGFSITRSSLDPERFFDGPLDGIILDDGSIVVRDGGTNTLTWLDSDGVSIRSAGGTGDGPGEFRNLSSVLRAPGSPDVWAWDSRARRLSRFDQSGEFVASITVPVGSGAPPETILPGPEFVTVATEAEASGEPTRRRYLFRDSLWAVVREVSGPPEPMPPAFTVEVSGVTHNHGLPEGCVPVLDEAAIGTTLFTGDAAAGTIHAVAEDGSMREIYRAARREAVTPEVRASLEAMVERRFSIPGREVPAAVRRSALEELRARLGDQLPAWQGMLADREARIWLERPQCPRADGSGTHYRVVDIEGARLGSVTIPDGSTLLAVRGDAVLVRRTGELGVQHIELYRLERQPADGG